MTKMEDVSAVVKYEYGDDTIVYTARLRDMEDNGSALEGIAELSIRVRRENFNSTEEDWFGDLDCEEKITFLDDQSLDLRCEAKVSYEPAGSPNYIRCLKELGIEQKREIPCVLLIDIFLPLEERLRNQLQTQLEEMTIEFTLQPNL